MKPIFASPFVRIDYDQSDQIIEVKWLQQPPSSEFRRCIRLILDFALARNIFRFLFDVHKRNYLPLQDQNWLLQDIVPLFRNRKVRLAYIVGIKNIEMMDIFHLKDTVARYNTFQVELFFTKPEARQWLVHPVDIGV
ncbi:hypothetical protein H7F15_19010 [Pontibacter sp. Tf4]|uniref:hypothetical protein n=1 Tax=Pontibacter sp. Tf4 TaxID=2761620 RepID=UPI001627687B|nr:hypothetical protein [Pontibacter sp. Tf4]MBB6613137.1 hypothetical protein [Pontibacter sp. Tf4]